jgi:MtN3 and saliva related transmembrane protein
LDVVGGLGMAAAVSTTICWMPQAWRTIRSGDTHAISLAFQALFAAGLALWVVYGVMIRSAPLILANVVSLPPVLVVLAFKIRNLRRGEAAVASE